MPEPSRGLEKRGCPRFTGCVPRRPGGSAHLWPLVLSVDDRLRYGSVARLSGRAHRWRLQPNPTHAHTTLSPSTAFSSPTAELPIPRPPDMPLSAFRTVRCTRLRPRTSVVHESSASRSLPLHAYVPCANPSPTAASATATHVPQAGCLLAFHLPLPVLQVSRFLRARCGLLTTTTSRPSTRQRR